jgi:hypothetical protein
MPSKTSSGDIFLTGMGLGASSEGGTFNEADVVGLFVPEDY